MLRDLDIAAQDSVFHEHASRLLLHRVCVDVVTITHVRILRATLLESFSASEDGAGERFLTRVRPNVIIQGTA